MVGKEECGCVVSCLLSLLHAEKSVGGEARIG